jgi:thymidylate synthase (FAD)
MKLIRPSYDLIAVSQSDMKTMEIAGRTCYQSEPHSDPETFIENIIDMGHLSVIEHSSLTIRFTVDRGVSHELVRHRLCAISQESTRWCKYNKGVTFIIPPWCSISSGTYDQYMDGACPDTKWFNAMLDAEFYYKELLDAGWSPQQARSVLPNSLKTTVVMTANFREWRHILTLRTSLRSHPQMREVMIPLLDELKELFPAVFSDLE